MAEKIHPASKPPTLKLPPARNTLNGGSATTNGTGNPAFPPTKSQLYGANRPTYRPQPKPRRRNRRSCCCACFLWTTLVIILLLLLGAIGGGVLYVLYRPQRPSFTVTSLNITQFNITTAKDDTSKLNSKMDLKISVRNPNKDLTFFYDSISVSVFTHGVDVSEGDFPGFVHGTKNSTVLKGFVSSQSRDLDPFLDVKTLNLLKSDLKKKSGLLLKIELNTKVRVKIAGKKMKKFGIQVKCDGIKAVPVSVKSKGKSPTHSWKLSESSDRKCKVNLRIKIWKWTF